ncbi:hypothetical protein PENTCL1PPCAC_13742, partial [Pristionchus entomophagus]
QSLADIFHEHQKHGVFKKFIDTITKQFLGNSSDQLLSQTTTLAINVIHRLVHSGKHAALFVEARTHKVL